MEAPNPDLRLCIIYSVLGVFKLHSATPPVSLSPFQASKHTAPLHFSSQRCFPSSLLGFVSANESISRHTRFFFPLFPPLFLVHGCWQCLSVCSLALGASVLPRLEGDPAVLPVCLQSSNKLSWISSLSSTRFLLHTNSLSHPVESYKGVRCHRVSARAHFPPRCPPQGGTRHR